MNCNVHMFYILIFSNKFGFILETSIFLYLVELAQLSGKVRETNKRRKESLIPSPGIF